MRILSGIQPSGKLHLGNFFGAIQQFQNFQAKNAELFIFVADWHALTTTQNPVVLQKNIQEVAAAFCAFDLTGPKTYLYRQSQVPEILELAWVLNCVAPLGLLERAVSFKDKIARGLKANVGLFNYPILQAADILSLQPDRVPVGKDQKQHLEMTRVLATKLNQIFQTNLKLPEPEIPSEVAIIPGTDGQKMSKSYGNTLDLFGSAAELKKQVMRIKTDSKALGAILEPAKCNVYQIFQLVAPAQSRDLAQQYQTGKIGYGDAKKLLLAAIQQRFDEARKKFQEYQTKPTELTKILAQGAAKARAEAQQTLKIVRQATGLGVTGS